MVLYKNTGGRACVRVCQPQLIFSREQRAKWIFGDCRGAFIYQFK
ncbi:hypothetical protein HMPREF1548_04294 [Clostridium sp. KLE 1755]|nr:hypothetical protein HMPREF1548_04294 [Clostridium sp. KLE 1755]